MISRLRRALPEDGGYFCEWSKQKAGLRFVAPISALSEKDKKEGARRFFGNWRRGVLSYNLQFTLFSPFLVRTDRVGAVRMETSLCG